MKKEMQFQTESRQLLDLMINSIYSNKEIFLRELISNASDAIDKYRYLSLTEPEKYPSAEGEIRLNPNKDGRYIEIIDNGIGMSLEEMESNLGTIARSGSKEFSEKIKKAKEAKRNQKVTEVKALRLSPVIDIGDFETKVKQVTKWISEGNKVKIDMRFRGRMMTRQDVGKKVMDNFITALSEVATVDKQPNLEGNTLSCVLSPIRK